MCNGLATFGAAYNGGEREGYSGPVKDKGISNTTYGVQSEPQAGPRLVDLHAIFFSSLSLHPDLPCPANGTDACLPTAACLGKNMDRKLRSRISLCDDE